jgi:Phosphotransferase enzyme family
VTLVLVNPSGGVLGALAPFPVSRPYRQEVEDVVAGARARYRLDVTVLRLLTADGPQVSYLAEVDGAPDPALLTPATVDGTHQPNRAPYAHPGGPRASLDWAWQALGCPPGRAKQVRTWNLSSLWMLHAPSGRYWLKEVPAFYAHEGAVLRWLAERCPGLSPRPVAVEGGRTLLPDVPGMDRYGASATERLEMLASLHWAHLEAAGAVPELLALGVPDGRAEPLATQLSATVRRFGRPRLADGIGERLAEAAACGIPDTLVHGDFHPGNVRGSTVLDWGDATIGHPGFDLLRLAEGLDDAGAALLARRWCGWWRVAVPGSRPERALELLVALLPLRHAWCNASFLDHIEPAEHVYHADDVPRWLAEAETLGRPLPPGWSECDTADAQRKH